MLLAVPCVVLSGARLSVLGGFCSMRHRCPSHSLQMLMSLVVALSFLNLCSGRCTNGGRRARGPQPAQEPGDSMPWPQPRMGRVTKSLLLACWSSSM